MLEGRFILRRAKALSAEATSRLWLLGVDKLGARPRVHGHVHVENLGRIEIGDDFCLRSQPRRSHLVTGAEGRIEIGDRVSIADGAAITAEERISIGDDVVLGAGVMLLDADYHTSGDRSAKGQRAPIIIERGARLEERVTVLHGAHIGKGAFVAAGSVVSGIVPDGARVGGVPAREIPSESAALHVPKAEAGDLVTRLERVVRVTFGLERALVPSDGPGAVPGWDSLGALRLLVALEDEFGVLLPEGALASAKTVEEIRALIEHQLEHPSHVLGGLP